MLMFFDVQAEGLKPLRIHVAPLATVANQIYNP